jgi:upstream activation factor subunit UAF30
MAFDLETLRPKIRAILTAPDTDLTSVSAKQIRDALVQKDGPFTPELAKEHKGALKQLIADVFNEVNGEQGEEAQSEVADHSSVKRRRDDDEDEEQDDGRDDEDDDETPPPKKKKNASKTQLSDAQLARQLSSELNGRPRAARAAAPKPKTKTGRQKGRPKVKSADIVESDDDDGTDDGGRKKAKRKSNGGGGARGGFAKEYILRCAVS